MFCRSSSLSHGLVCSMWLWYFLIILTFCSYITQFLRSRRLFKMGIYQPYVMPLVMPQPGFWSDSIHFRVLILFGALSGNGKISCWQAFNNARDSIQEAFCYLRPMSLKSRATGVLEEYVCKLYQSDADNVWLTEWRWWMFWRKKLNCVTYHLQELRFSKVSNVGIINSSLGNPHPTLILTNQCLTTMVWRGTVINIFLLWRHYLLILKPHLQLIKCLCSKSECQTSRCKCKAKHLYCTELCWGPMLDIASEQLAMTFELPFSCGSGISLLYQQEGLTVRFWPLKDQILDDSIIVECKRKFRL